MAFLRLKDYRPEEVSLSWNTIDITGWNAVRVSRAEDGWTPTVGTVGEVVRTQNANRMGTIEIDMMMNAESNKLLMAAAKTDEESGVSISNFAINDPSGTTLTFAADCWARKIPDIELAKEYGEITWVFDVTNLQIIPGLGN